MNKYVITIILFLTFYLVASVILRGILNRDTTKVKIKSRSRMDDTGRRRSAKMIKSQMSSILEEKATVAKKYSIETMCAQAGHPISYGEYRIITIGTSIILPLLSLICIHNFILALLFCPIGYCIPGQYFKAKANKRVIKMETQCGSFLRIVIERYKNSEDMAQAISQTLPDFKGADPFYTELKQTVIDLNKGIPTEVAITELARRTGNKYLKRFSDYYKITYNIETLENKVSLLNQAYVQFEENRKIKELLKEKISGPVREAYIMVMATPVFMIYQSFATEGYLDFMINDKVGQMGIAGVVIVLLGCIWFINAKIGAPVD